MKNVDTGKYHVNPKEYEKLVKELYEENPNITLPPEYSHFIKNDILRLLIRLARYKFIARLIKEKDSVLEIGCGSGLGAIFLSQHCQSVTGLDVKTTEIEEARSMNRRENVEFIVKDLYELDRNSKFDVVVALDVIEHMPVEEGDKLVRKMSEHLRDTGMLVIGSPSIYSYPYQSPLSQASHVKCYDQKELTELIDKHFGRSLAFSMNDEVIHTGHPKMAWYYYILGFLPKPL